MYLLLGKSFIGHGVITNKTCDNVNYNVLYFKCWTSHNEKI
jgi:hypothetical protein